MNKNGKNYKLLDEKPIACIECNNPKIMEMLSKDVDLYCKDGGITKPKYMYLWVCVNCSTVLGYADNRPSPKILIDAHERPDISAKYQEVLSNGII